MDDDDAILERVRQVTEIFKEKFRSDAIQNENEDYVEDINQQLTRWQSDTTGLINTIIEEKSEELNQLHDRYWQEAHERYAQFREESEKCDSIPALDNQIKNFNNYCQSNTIESRIRSNIKTFKKEQLAEKLKLEYVPLGIGSVPDTQKGDTYNNGSVSKPSTHVSTRESFTTPNKSTTTTVDNSRKTPIRLYVGRDSILTPILVDKNSQVDKEDEKEIKYSIDSIPIPKSKQQQSSNVNTDNDDFEKLVHAYKVLVKQENDNNQKHSPSPSDRSNDEEANHDNVFNLRKLNRTNYSTIMFRECETEFNCIASSTKRNELIVYNSKLKVLIILEHENHKQRCNRLYLQWSNTLNSQISDITYCQNNDQFLISTQDTRHLYFLNRDPSAISELDFLWEDFLPEDLPLRRIHCYQQTVYCILGDNYLGEFQLNKEYSSLKFIRRITLFYPTDDPQDTTYHLLDITCDKNRLIVVYANDQDEIHLQSIDRKTRKLQGHLLLDESEHFNQIDIRIESTIYNGNFIYLNGSRKHLKSIDFRNNDNGEITSKVARHKKPINLCFLEDGRLVILYKEPYFLSVHNSTNHP